MTFNQIEEMRRGEKPSLSQQQAAHRRAEKTDPRGAAMTEYTLRQVGDTWIVDADYAPAIYVASPMPNYPLTPKERAEMYIRAATIENRRARGK